MIASWLGQVRIVERLVADGEDNNAQWDPYGTALNIAAIREHEDVTRVLLQGNVNAHLFGKEFNILQTKRVSSRHG
jgi:ankyrin repeat protein